MEDIEKQKILYEANVLLISDAEYEYKEFADYGFKNIDQIKSVVRAGKYFDEYPEQLEKYHIPACSISIFLISSNFSLSS